MEPGARALSRGRLLVAVLGLCGAVGACARELPPPTRVGFTDGFQTPEAVKYDPELDLYWVSNIVGNPSQKDNNGAISRVGPDGGMVARAFIEGGKPGVTLHAPKGMAIAGDTLWVTDIDALRGFDRRTGAPLATVELNALGARFLNDVAVGPDGSIYITDTGIQIDTAGQVQHPGPDRVFRVGANREVTVALQGDTLQWPNGITWDSAGGRFVIVAFGGPSVYAWRPSDSVPSPIATGVGSFDGVERLPDGRFLVSTWADSSLYLLDGGTLTPYIRNLPAPADIGLDPTRNRVAIPLFTTNRIEIWQIPTR